MNGRLVITRKEGEELHIVQNGVIVATIQIAEVSGDHARLAIQADNDLGIFRAELLTAPPRRASAGL